MRQHVRLLILVAILGPVIGPGALASEESPENNAVIALVGGRVLTQTDAGSFEGTIVIRDGRIAAVGPEVEIPDGADRIDVRGLVVSPGLIDARSVLWLTPKAREDGSGDGSLDILDAVDPYAEDWPDVLRGGVTAVYVQPANSGLFGGRGAILHVGPGGSLDDLVLKPDAAVQAALGVNESSTNAVLRYQQFENLKRAIESIKKYKDEWESYKKALKKYEAAKTKYDAARDRAEGEGREEDEARKETNDDDSKNDQNQYKEDSEPNQEPSDSDADQNDEDEKAPSPPEPPEAPDRDPDTEFLVQLLDGDVPLRIEAHREDDVRNALALADEFDLSLILEGLSDPQGAREELVKRRTPMVLGPILRRDDPPFYRLDRARTWPADLLADDSRWALGTYGDQPADSARLRAHAASAIARGVPADQALRAVTAGAAEVLGVDDQIGSIAKGRRADLVVFDGEPLDPSSTVRLVLSGGEVVVRNLEDRPIEPADVPSTSVIDPDLPDRLPRRYLVRSRRLLGPDGRFAPGAFRVIEGTIVASSQEIRAADGEFVLDLKDAAVTPGLVSAHSTLGLTRALDESAGADASFLRASDVYDPSARSVGDLVRGGVLRVAFAPGSSNVAAGAVAAVRLGTDDAVIDPEIGAKFVLTGSARQPDRYPVSLPGQVALIDGILSGAPPELDYTLSGPVLDLLRDQRIDRAARLKAGQSVAFFQVATPAEIEAALGLIEQHVLDAVLIGPDEIEPYLETMARLNVGLVLEPIEPGPDAARQLGALVQASALGVPIAFAADRPEQLRLLASQAVASGLPRADALRALTSTASETVRLSGSSARLQPDGPADFVVWDGSPLDLRSRPLCVVIAGQVVD